MHIKLVLPTLAAFLCAGCYHVTVVTGAPEAAQKIDKEWQNSFVYGLVPPTQIEAQSTCAQGVAKVETERTFLNGLVGAITYSIYTPMHTKVTCAAGPVAR
ncbi:MAG TPA: Bor family protein [Gemmatimonadaceae bacterium]|nr:Bor family protein [Gemmatimonadaceae bacterium]